MNAVEPPPGSAPVWLPGGRRGDPAHAWWRDLARAVDDGNRQASDDSISTAEFDEFWESIEATGWRNLGDCAETEPKEGEPTYKIGVKDESQAVSMTCTGRVLPFPYNRLVDSMDLLAAQYRQ